jgi:hypothetical protein
MAYDTVPVDPTVLDSMIPVLCSAERNPRWEEKLRDETLHCHKEGGAESFVTS